MINDDFISKAIEVHISKTNQEELERVYRFIWDCIQAIDPELRGWVELPSNLNWNQKSLMLLGIRAYILNSLKVLVGGDEQSRVDLLNLWVGSIILRDDFVWDLNKIKEKLDEAQRQNSGSSSSSTQRTEFGFSRN